MLEKEIKKLIESYEKKRRRQKQTTATQVTTAISMPFSATKVWHHSSETALNQRSERSVAICSSAKSTIWLPR